jgi:predicted RNA methylase
MSFENLGLAPFLLRALSEQGYENPTPIQEQAIPLALEGRDLLAGANVLELGAGCGLTSVVACKLGASLCVCTDYPADGVIENIATQLVSCGVDPAVALAVGHSLPLSVPFEWPCRCVDRVEHFSVARFKE